MDDKFIPKSLGNASWKPKKISQIPWYDWRKVLANEKWARL